MSSSGAAAPTEPSVPGHTSAVQVRSRLHPAKKVLFTFVTLVAFFGLLELILAITGIEPLADDIYQGFSASVPVFTEQSQPDGRAEMVTATNRKVWINPQRFERRKPAGLYRIFTLGGSTTHGYPYDDTTSFSGWLREFLLETDDSRQYEVINAGGISYATHRISLVMNELVRYEPDLFIIYTGHNEFLERLTYASMLDTPSAVSGLGGFLSGTRTFSVISSLVRPTAETVSNDDQPIDQDKLLDDNKIGLDDYHRDDRNEREVLAQYRSNLLRMIDLARKASAKVMLVTPACNLRDWPPWKNEHRAGLSNQELGTWNGLVNSAEQAFSRDLFDEALTAIDKAATIDDRYAGLHFLRGQILDRLGDREQAKQAFIRARDEDVCPLRTSSRMHTILTDVVAQTNVSLVPFDMLAEEHSEQGIPGDNLFHDHVHPKSESNQILARAIYDEMERAGLAHATRPLNDETMQNISERIAGRRDKTSEALALANLSNVLKLAGKFDESLRVAIQAAALAPDDAELQFMVAIAHRDEGQMEQAERCFRTVLSLNPESPETHNNLGMLAAQKGNADQAEDHFRRAIEIRDEFAEAHNNLGIIFAQRGELETAAVEFRKALSHKKHYTDAQRNLEQVEASLGKPN